MPGGGVTIAAREGGVTSAAVKLAVAVRRVLLVICGGLGRSGGERATGRHPGGVDLEVAAMIVDGVVQFRHALHFSPAPWKCL